MFRTLLQQVNMQRSKPIFVKIPPYATDQEQEQVLTLVRIAREQGVEGITAANTRRVEAPELATKCGGLSGRPLLEDTIRIVADVRAEAGPTMAINASGGIFGAEDALRALQAGATTVQVYTSFIYRGPGIARSINQGLLQQIQERGFNSLADFLAAIRKNSQSRAEPKAALEVPAQLAHQAVP